MVSETGSADATAGPAKNDDSRERVKRGLLYAFVMTPLLGLQLAIGSVDPVSTRSVLVAVPLGTVLGVVAFVVVERIEYEPESEFRSLAVMLVLIAVAVVLSWLLIPADESGAFLVGTTAFIWAGALANATRHVVIPWIGEQKQ
jgi:hypothetical protein